MVRAGVSSLFEAERYFKGTDSWAFSARRGWWVVSLEAIVTGNEMSFHIVPLGSRNSLPANKTKQI